MRLAIEHQTTYRFSAQQARLVQMLRLTPQNTHDQTVVRWRIDVDRDARLRDRRDGWGNAVTMLYVEGPLDAITIAVSGEVLTSHSDGVVRGIEEPLAPELFRRTTPATAADAQIAEWARDTAAGADALSAMHRLNTDLHGRFAVDHGRPDVWLDAADAWTQASATPRDLAQMLIAAARSLTIPARYVSGYRGDGGAEQATPHGWAEAHVAGLGWVGFDPCTGLSPQEDHVRIAVALDAAGAAPIAGSRLGEGDEELNVELRVSEA